MEELQIGMKLQHYKGGIYEVLSFGTHSETLEEMVVYIGEDYNIWIRPLSMFYDLIIHEGKVKPRFKRLKSEKNEK